MNRLIAIRIYARILIGGAAIVVVAALIALLAMDWNRPEERVQIPAAASPGERNLVMLVVDRLAFAEMRSGAGPVLRSFLNSGIVSLMNVRSGRSGSESGYLSLGAGARASAGPEGNRAYSRNEAVEGYPAETLYQRYTGIRPVGEVLHLHALSLQERNNALPYPVTVGLLGQLLAEAGLQAAVVGHADAAGPGRGAAMIAMDSRGEISLGAAGFEVVVDDPLSPFGLRTDPVLFGAAVEQYLGEAQLVVADFGDLSRLDQYWVQLSPGRRGELFAAAMANLDLALERILPVLNENTMLMMVTPSAPANRPGGGEQLVPFIMIWPHGPGPGLLNSPATRRDGLITNTDVAPMVYSFLRGEPLQASGGEEIRITASPDPPGHLESFAAQSQRVFQLRPPVIKGFILVLVVVLLAGLAGLVLRLPLVKRLFFILEGLMLFPLVLLLEPGLTRVTPLSPLWTVLFIAGGTLLLLLMLYPLKRKGLPLFWAFVGLITAVALLVDMLTGANLQQASFLGYDPIGGARYYGIGNEYMGVLIGSAVLGTVTLAGMFDPYSPPGEERRSGFGSFYRFTPLRLAILLFYGLIIFLLASPRFGANLGGTLAAAVAFGAAWAGWNGFLKRGRTLPLLLTFALFLSFALGLLWTLNILWQPALSSHLGHFGETVRSRGFEGLWETVLRKINMNWRLIRYSIWSRAFATLLGLLVLLFFYPIGILKRLKEEQPYLINGAAAALVGSTTALLVNDSGIVAAAMVLLYAAPPVFFAIMNMTLAVSEDCGP